MDRGRFAAVPDDLLAEVLRFFFMGIVGKTLRKVRSILKIF